ncbi:hypothetical protein PSRA_1617 [Pseudoscardovia radai]|uniref:Uncharacterized protein n=1 Tax=Pseudoscardovia radai TaxID=987066 RepID=A0A261ER84_9BIFI|nr:hypothetical protein [Pseudoscardovia radai]OZG49368.1 hypothetical protein PSRA_1617 [Pseudoscardovia radai]
MGILGAIGTLMMTAFVIALVIFSIICTSAPGQALATFINTIFNNIIPATFVLAFGLFIAGIGMAVAWGFVDDAKRKRQTFFDTIGPTVAVAITQFIDAVYIKGVLDMVGERYHDHDLDAFYAQTTAAGAVTGIVFGVLILIPVFYTLSKSRDWDYSKVGTESGGAGAGAGARGGTGFGGSAGASSGRAIGGATSSDDSEDWDDDDDDDWE